MSSTADTDDVIEVSADGLTVRKRFAADEFPVPAIRFEIESDHDEPVTFRLSEEIPESFPMDKVGFHPEYYSDDWTAFQDNHVEFTGTLESDEPLVTVYGIRIDDESVVTEFLTEPTVVEVSSEDAADSDADAISDDVIETIVGDDRSQPVKDMISGESDSVPGLEDEDLDIDLEDDVDLDETTEFEDDEPDVELGFEEDEIPGTDEDEAIEAAPPDEEALDLGLDADETGEDEADDADADPSNIDLGLEEESDPELPEDAAVDDAETSADVADEESEDIGTEDEDGDTEKTDDDTEDVDIGDDEGDIDPKADDADDGDEPADADSPADVADTDVEPDASDESPAVDESEDATDGTSDETSESDAIETEPAETESAEDESDVAFEGSIGARLATEIREGTVDEDDLEALRSELDLEPSGSEIAKVEHLQSRVEEVAAYTDALERFLDEQGTGEQLIEEFQTELASFEDELAAMDDQLEDTESRVDGVETDVESLTDWTADLETDLGEVAADVETVEDDLEDVSDDVETVDERVDDVADDVADLEDDLEDVQEGLTDIQDWRDQLGSMFSDS
ncbi:AAA family ATPase [Natronococcus pandeyae]|uniref:AAA family ATPase n=1 Tax=Natronococcus pandeyae TaxID=2055836 RepID=A0A8J8TR20_9EURY|nr:AAA family ATPase [Natronococcus pandeyae]TYL37102.1 AAA family ATPase [Natronococcus pandeyae]